MALLFVISRVEQQVHFVMYLLRKQIWDASGPIVFCLLLLVVLAVQHILLSGMLASNLDQQIIALREQSDNGIITQSCMINLITAAALPKETTAQLNQLARMVFPPSEAYLATRTRSYQEVVSTIFLTSTPIF